MYKLTLLCIFVGTATLGKPQNIYSALHLNENREYKTAKPKKIVETNTFYNSGGRKVEKAIKLFDSNGMLTSEERYDEDDNLTARLTWVYDTTLRLKVAETFERWGRFVSGKEITVFGYDSSMFLTSVTTKNENGKIIRDTRLVNDEKGNPVELMPVGEDAGSLGKETGKYLYEKNKVATSVIASDGRVISTDTLKIRFKNACLFPGEGETYNGHGDLVSWTSKGLNGNETVYEEKYVYDKWGNCTEQRIYKATPKKNGGQHEEIDRVFKKEYTY